MTKLRKEAGDVETGEKRPVVRHVDMVYMVDNKVDNMVDMVNEMLKLERSGLW